MIQELTYQEVLSEKYPNVKVASHGDGSDYESLQWLSGDPLPSKQQLDIDKDAHTRIRVWREIKAERDRRQACGVLVNNKWFHSDVNSRIQQLALVIFGANVPPIMWKTMDGSFILMTPTLAIQIFQASAASDIAIFNAAEQHKANMMASATPNLYDFSSGWPPIFAGTELN